jgi:hypothetical protein
MLRYIFVFKLVVHSAASLAFLPVSEFIPRVLPSQRKVDTRRGILYDSGYFFEEIFMVEANGPNNFVYVDPINRSQVQYIQDRLEVMVESGPCFIVA